MDCKNYEKKGLTGLVIFIIFFVCIYLCRLNNVGFFSIVPALILGLFGIKYTSHYVMCLQENNRKFKPPK